MQITAFSRYSIALLLSCALGGCDSIWNFANSVGDHMPVVGERCEHWQCFTNPTENSNQAKTPQNPPTTSATPATSSAPVAPSTPASAPKTNTATPFDMTPQQLQNLPPPVIGQPGL